MSDGGRKMLNIIIALLVSLGAWIYVVYNNDPMTEVTYKDIPISFQGESTLANRGFGVSQASDDTIDIILKQPRVRTGEISAEDIEVVADVSDAVEGENGISLEISGPENTQVKEASKRSISVEIEEADSIEKEIIIEYLNNATSNEPVASAASSSRATVIGAASEIERVDKVAALLEFEETGHDPINITSVLTALDKDGDPIEHVVIYPAEINFYAYNGATKKVPLIIDADQPDDNYDRTWTAPQEIVIKGSSDHLQAVNQIRTQKIDLSNIYENTELDLEYDLPEGIYLANESLGQKIRIRVTEKKSEDTDEDGGTETDNN